MTTWLTAYIVAMPEYQAWHILNLETGTFLITVGLTFFLQLPGIIAQVRKIWKNRSVVGVEPLTFIVFFTYSLVFLVYSLEKHVGAGIINRLVLVGPQILILAGLVHFGRLRRVDLGAALAGGILFLLTIAFPLQNEKFFSIASVAFFLGMLLQPIRMLRTSETANIAILFPIMFAIVCGVWAIYGWAIGDWYIAVSSCAFGTVYIWIACLCVLLRSAKSRPA